MAIPIWIVLGIPAHFSSRSSVGACSARAAGGSPCCSPASSAGRSASSSPATSRLGVGHPAHGGAHPRHRLAVHDDDRPRRSTSSRRRAPSPRARQPGWSRSATRWPSTAQAAGPARRYREVLRLARANGVIGSKVDTIALPEGARRTLEQAGGIFVKLGQVASTRSDVLPAAWCDELSKLRSSAEPAPEKVMRPHVEAQLGRPVEEVYAEFDWTPHRQRVHRPGLRRDAARRPQGGREGAAARSRRDDRRRHRGHHEPGPRHRAQHAAGPHGAAHRPGPGVPRRRDARSSTSASRPRNAARPRPRW